MITTGEVRAVVETGDVIEHYPEDARGHSCLMLGLGRAQRHIHVVCSPKSDFLAIVTAYVPSPTEWRENCRIRINP
jgi:hypothetical protein